MPKSSPQRRQRKAQLGQNFLVSPTAPSAIVKALGDLSETTVVEIGPGRGVITRLLALGSRRLIAIELDRSLAAALTLEFAGQAAVEIVCQDILSVDLNRMASQFSGRLRVAGNLPYYITSDILLHLFRYHEVIESAVLMAQREVAARIVASPGSRDYGLLSATTQMYARAEPLFELAPEAFSPPPEVHSAVFRLFMRPRFAELGVEQESFLHFLRLAFAQKRKTLGNNFRAAGYEAGAIQAALTECNVDHSIRAEAVSLEAMACLFHALGRRTTDPFRDAREDLLNE